MPTVRDTYALNLVAGYVPKQLPDASDIWKIDSKELIGIEVEVENQAHRRPSNTVWTITDDGSLRNGGVEFISRPIAASYAPAALKHLFHGDFDQEYCFSPRTSVHVHLNMQDAPTEKVIDLLFIYCLFEKVLYRFVGKGRWRNIYSTPITETTLLSTVARNGINCTWEKYTGFNLLPLREKGTVEFRHMHGTIDVKKLCVWIDLITHLKAYVMRIPTEQIRKTIINFNGGQIDSLGREVFGELYEYLQVSDPSEVVSRVPIVKTGMVRSDSLHTLLLKSRSLQSKFYKVA